MAKPKNPALSFRFPPLVATRLSELAKMHHTNQTQMLIRLIMEAKK
jgi:hypothetical protein